MKKLFYTLLLIGSCLSGVWLIAELLPISIITEAGKDLLSNEIINSIAKFFGVIGIVFTIVKCNKEITR